MQKNTIFVYTSTLLNCGTFRINVRDVGSIGFLYKISIFNKIVFNKVVKKGLNTYICH